MIRLIFSGLAVVLLFGVMLQPSLVQAEVASQEEIDASTARAEARQKTFDDCKTAAAGDAAALADCEKLNPVTLKPEDDVHSAEKSTPEIDAVKEYVKLADIKGFSLSDVSVGNEKNLVIDNSNNDNNILARVIRVIAMLVGTVGVLLYVVGGYFMIFSQGDENQLTKGKQIVTYTSLGLVIAFGAFILVQFIMGIIYSAA